MTLRPPDGVWSPRGTVVVLLALLAPTAAAVALEHDGDAAALLASAATMVVGCGFLTAAGLLVAHARLAGNDHVLWLATALGVCAVATLARGGYALTHPAAVEAHAATVLAGNVVLMSVLAVLVAVARRHGQWLHPVAVGVPLAVVALVVQQSVLVAGPAVDTALVPAAGFLLCVLSFVFAAVVRQLDAMPAWARDRLGIAVLFCTLSTVVLSTRVPGAPLAPATGSLLLGLAGAVLLATTAAALLREVMTEERRQLADLQRRLAASEQDHRADSARLHDINSLVAGIASASRLVQDLPPSRHRAGLEVMVLAEIDRLQRLLAARDGDRVPSPTPAEPPEIVAREVLSRIALSHRARGRGVTSAATDVRLRGDADDLAQLLDILVDNAAQHGSPDYITLEAHRVGPRVEISVRDRGPGVPSDLRDTVFSYGTRGPGSQGTGIGLHTAQVLAARLGGVLRLEEPDGSGTRVVLSVPDPDRSEVLAREDFAVAG